MDSNHSDIIIIGAGLSGIGGLPFVPQNPNKTYLILELEPKLAVLGVYFNIQVSPIPICTPLAIPLKLGKKKSFADGSTI
jgi:hypothetical protein